MLKNVRNNKLTLDDIVLRKEYHHFYDEKRMHIAFIFALGSKEVWIKEKSDTNIVHTPRYKIPILIRKEKKIRPSDLGYDKLFLKTLKSDYIASFKKECIDISFWFENFLFTITVAESVTNKSSLSQIEIEYDGRCQNTECPSRKSLLTLFDKVSPYIITRIGYAFYD
jgi:hypothetical protein